MEGHIQDITSQDHDRDLGEVCPAGKPDPTFGDKGSGFVLLPVNKTEIDQAKDVAVDSSGRIVVSGQLWTASTGNDWYVARYLESGVIDASFNGKGFVQTGGDKNDALFGMGIDGKGRIVIGGMSYKAGAQHELALARYTAAGTLDSSFGTNGTAMLDYGSYDERVTNLVFDPQNRVVFSGWTEKSSAEGNKRFLAGRLTEAGDKDLTFNETGIAELAFANTAASAWAVGLDSAGRVVIGGWVWSSVTKLNDVAVARHLTDGALDPSFGTGGEVQTEVKGTNEDKVRDLTIDGDNNIFLVGQTGATPTGRLFVLKLRSDGSPDPAFGEKGVYLLDASLDSSGYSVSIDAAGRILAVGSATGPGDLDVVVVRLRKDGSPDPTLGNGAGHVLIDLGRDENVRESAIDSAGRLLVTGWQEEDATTDSYLLRLCL